MLKKFEAILYARNEELEVIYSGHAESNDLIDIFGKISELTSELDKEYMDYERSKLHDDDTDDLPF